MTILSTQLLALRQKTTSALEVDKRKRASILFKPEDAMTLSQDVVLEMARTGLESLAEIDPQINAFSQDLFGQTTLKLERGMLKPEINEEYSEKIRKCLAVLSSHVLLRPGQKCIEWLLSKFYIAEVQAQDLLFMLLPYHDTTLFSKMSVQVRLPNEWRWLKAFKKQPPTRNIVLRELRSNPVILSEFLNFVNLVRDDESSPLMLFAIAMNNIIIREKPKDAILAVIVSNCLKFLQFGTTGLRAHALSALGNMCLQNLNCGSTMDNSLGKKILKVIIPEGTGDHLAPEALFVAGLVYHLTESEFELPKKFINRAIMVLNRHPEAYQSSNQTSYQKKIMTALFEAALENAMVMESMETDNSDTCYEDFIKQLLKSTCNIDIENALNIALKDHTSDISKYVISDIGHKYPQALAAKVEGLYETIGIEALSPQLLIHHEDENIRLNAFNAMDSNQGLIKRLLSEDPSLKVCLHALQRLEKTTTNIMVITEFIRKHKVGTRALIDIYSAECNENQKSEIVAFVISFGADHDISFLLEKLNISSIIYYASLKTILDIMVSENLVNGLLYVASTTADHQTSGSKVAELLMELALPLDVQHKIATLLVKCNLPELLICKIAKLSFTNPNLAALFMKHQLNNSRVDSIHFFANFGIKNPLFISGSIAMLYILLQKRKVEFDRTVQIAAFVAISSSIKMDRINGIEVLKKTMELEDPMVSYLIKMIAELTSDATQLKQILNKKLRKRPAYVENFRLLENLENASDAELIFLLNFISPVIMSEKFSVGLQDKINADADAELLGSLFKLIPEIDVETMGRIVPKIENVLENLNHSSYNLILVSLLQNGSNLDCMLAPLIKKILLRAQTYTIKSRAITQSVAEFVTKANVDLLNSLLAMSGKEDTNCSVISAKRKRRTLKPEEIEDTGLDFYLFVLENCGLRSLKGLEQPLNTILGKSLKNEGVTEDRIQSTIIALCVDTDMLKPEYLVEVVRRCSVCEPRDGVLNLTLIAALRLLSHLAISIPDQVLNSLMSVFTFMGRGLLPRADDRYSFDAIQETIRCVVPPLLKQSHEPVYKIIETFVNATPHVPIHRRETVFQSLMVTCGVTESLHICWLTLAVRHIMAQRESNIQDPTEFSEMMNDLIARFSVREIIDSTVQLAQYLVNLEFKLASDTLTKSKILDPAMTDKDLTNLHYFLNFFIHRLYSSHDFLHGQLARITDEEELNLNDSYIGLLNHLLTYTGKIHVFMESEQSNLKNLKLLNSKANGCVDRVLSLLPPIEFAQCTCSLIRSSVKDKKNWLLVQSLEMLYLRLKRTEEVPEDQPEVVLMTTILKELLRVIECVEGVLPINLSLKAIKIIIKSCPGLINEEKSTNILLKILHQLKLIMENDKVTTEVKWKDSVFGSLILCASVLISKLEIKSLPHMEWVMNAITEGSKKANTDQIKLILIISLSKVLESMSKFISPYIENILMLLCQFDTRQQGDLGTSLNKAIEIVSRISSRLFLPVVSNIYSKLTDENICTLLYIVERYINNVDKTTAINQQAYLGEFFIESLEFRTKRGKLTSPSLLKEIENATSAALVRLSLKLSEASLRPLLYKIFTWATLPGSPTTRILSLYTLYSRLASSLKSMFPLFTGSLGPHLIELIPKINDELTPLLDDANDQRELLNGILFVLKSIFTYDHGEFMEEQALNDLITHVINLMEMVHLPEYDDFCTQFLVPTISQAAASIRDETIWRPLNYRILLKMRHEDPKVRICALNTIESVVTKLGEDYQNLLHESAPFLAELLEDDDGDVEKKIHETIKYLDETFNGEMSNFF